jgi:hypothetical protein
VYRFRKSHRLRTRMAALLTAAAVAGLGVTGIGALVAAPAHAGLDGPMATNIDQHCLIDWHWRGVVIRKLDWVTVRVESLHGAGSAWIDYEIPGVLARTAGPRGTFDPQSRSVAFTFPVRQPAPGSSLVIYAGSVWSDGTTHQNQFTVQPPATCDQVSGNSADSPDWTNFADIGFSQQCRLTSAGPYLRWVNRVTVTLAVGEQYDFQPGDAWVDYWVSGSGRTDYSRAAQGHFDPGSRTLTLAFDLAPGHGATELGVVGGFDWDGRAMAAHAWAPLQHCGWVNQVA